MAEDTIQLTELIRSLRQLRVETGSLACLGCAGSDGRCSTRGCAIIRQAIRALSTQDRRGRWQEGEFPRVYRCEACGKYTDWISHGQLPPPPFCCWCGARMDGEARP